MYCSNCGYKVGAEAKFCPQCGTAQKTSQDEANIYVPLQRDIVTKQDEAVLTVLSAADKNQSFLQKIVSVIVTSQRLIIANTDSKLFADYQKEYKAKIEAEGQKGLGKFWSVATSGYEFLNRYLEMPPEAILAERDKNYQFYNSEIQEIALSSKNVGSSDNYTTQIEMMLKAKGKKYKYVLNNATISKKTLEILADLFGPRFNWGNTRFF